MREELDLLLFIESVKNTGNPSLQSNWARRAINLSAVAAVSGIDKSGRMCALRFSPCGHDGLSKMRSGADGFLTSIRASSSCLGTQVREMKMSDQV
jgi:hypothetical protein